MVLNNSNCAKLAEERLSRKLILMRMPSDRVQNGMFGACLMAKADLVADCVEQMQKCGQNSSHSENTYWY